jgi:hypothetical protein
VLAVSILVAIATIFGSVEFRRRSHLHPDSVYIAVVPLCELAVDEQDPTNYWR